MPISYKWTYFVETKSYNSFYETEDFYLLFSFFFPFSEGFNPKLSEGNFYYNYMKMYRSCHLNTSHFLKILDDPISVYMLSLICLGALFFYAESLRLGCHFSELVKMFNKLKHGTILKLSVRNKSSKYIVIWFYTEIYSQNAQFNTFINY